MDKLRAIEYFMTVCEAGSFSAAARTLTVSPPAVSKLIAALERQLGTALLHRDSRHVTLTADGERYLQVCTRTVADLRGVEQSIGGNRARVSGKLVVGVSRVLGANSLMPFLPEFLKRHPDVELDVRAVHYPNEAIAALCDVLVLIGWGENLDWVMRTISWSRMQVVAAPAYWKEHGLPEDPDELPEHRCLAYRLPRGLVYDRWKFRRGEDTRSVSIRPFMVSDDRDAILHAAMAGAGLFYAADLTMIPWLRQGALQPALADWTGEEAPAVRILFRRGGRASARVRAFGDFVIDVFRRLEAARTGPDTAAFPATTPDWYLANHVGGLAGRWKPRARQGTRR